MGINKVTLKMITENRTKFSEELFTSIQNLIDLAIELSPLSDLNYLIEKKHVSLSGIIFGTNSSSWMPVRNVIRIIAMIADEVRNINEQVTEIQINSMYIGCDFFNGHLSYTIASKKVIAGKYKWKWTAFPGYDRNYNKFTEFPKISVMAYDGVSEFTV